MKTCITCKKSKDLTLFGKDSRNKDGKRNQCKDCYTSYHSNLRLANPEKYKSYLRIWKLDNPEKVQRCQKTCSKKPRKINNLEKHRSSTNAASKAWNLRNPEKLNSYQAKRRAKKLQATPKWVEFEKSAIQELYLMSKIKTKLTGIKHHVDHIVPLNSDIVQGFHCLANLQVLEAKTNITKGNRVWPDMP